MIRNAGFGLCFIRLIFQEFQKVFQWRTISSSSKWYVDLDWGPNGHGFEPPTLYQSYSQIKRKEFRQFHLWFRFQIKEFLIWFLIFKLDIHLPTCLVFDLLFNLMLSLVCWLKLNFARIPSRLWMELNRIVEIWRFDHNLIHSSKYISNKPFTSIPTPSDLVSIFSSYFMQGSRIRFLF